MSVVAIRDICGRCAAAAVRADQPDHPHTSRGVDADFARLRGLALVALDKRRYPKLLLAEGKKVGPGLDAWAPVLRAMDANELRDLTRLVEGKPR